MAAARGPAGRDWGWVSARPGSVQDEVNRRIYNSPRLVWAYARRTLVPAERAVFSRIADTLSGGRVLELGCGAGRITRHLLTAGADVVGVDVSPAMVDYCRRVLPGGTFVVGDLRDLSDHPDACFDVVVGGANVLDAVSHEERLSVLAEARRVLVPGGLLYFSSHNLRSARALSEARTGPTLRFAKNPYRQMRAMANYVQGRVNHPRLACHQRFEDDHAILNDEAHGWRLLHYYIDHEAQREQLAANGFELLETTGPDGRSVGRGADDSRFSELHYLARSR
jgi:SAM-dependent methyltransferase